MNINKISLALLIILSFPILAQDIGSQQPNDFAISDEKKSEQKIKFDITHDEFDQTFSPSSLETISYSKAFPIGAVIPKITHASRFGTEGLQYEIESYPRILKNYYGYLDLAYSTDSIFPNYRFGAEIFHNFPNAWEVSFGFRSLYFTNSETWIFTGSVGKYIGNYYYLTRLYYTPNNIGPSYSLSANVRYYLSDESYIGGGLGAGLSTDQTTWNKSITQGDSKKISAEIYYGVYKDLYIQSSLTLSTEKLPNGSYRQQTSLSAGIEKRF